MDADANVVTALRRTPSWWTSSARVEGRITRKSAVIDVQETAPGIVSVLIAQPLPNFDDIPVDPKTFAGVLRRFGTILEIIDVNTGTVVSSGRVRGYPRQILGSERIATYLEDDDGTPIIDIDRFGIKP